MPMMEPILKTRQRHVSVFVVLSAKAVAPWACTGAIGYGSFSKSAVSLYKK